VQAKTRRNWYVPEAIKVISQIASYRARAKCANAATNFGVLFHVMLLFYA